MGFSKELKHDVKASHFAGFPPHAYWRLFIDRNRQDSEGPMSIDHSSTDNEAGYLRSMQMAANFVLETIDNDINLDYLIKLRKNAIRYNMYFLQSALAHEDKHEGISTRLGFGIGNYEKIGPNITEAGLAELLKKMTQGDTSFRILRKNPYETTEEIYDTQSLTSMPTPAEIKSLFNRIITEKNWKIIRLGDDIEKVKQRARDIMNQYQTSIRTAKNDTDKILAIAICIHELELAHPFADGNCRTFCVLLLNKLLLQQNLSPSIVENPNKFDAYSIDELCDLIRDGQKAFAQMKSLKEDKFQDTPCLFLENNKELARLMALEISRQCKHWDKLPLSERESSIDLLAKLLSRLSLGRSLAECMAKLPRSYEDFLTWDSTEQHVTEQTLTSGGLTPKQINSVIAAIQQHIEAGIHDASKSWLKRGLNLLSKTPELPDYHIKLEQSALENTLQKLLQTQEPRPSTRPK